MSISIGSYLGSHEITALLGKGGMGEVYRAHDSKLKRDVAIKVLPEEFWRDDDRVSRFQREAQLLASLNHPKIEAIYDLQEANGYRFLVLELIEGETLADRIASGPLAEEGAVEITCQICEALEVAHEKGVIHRDLKPANVKITSDGKVKVLDFGLAKAIDTASTGTALSNSPTLVNTSPGIIMGTAGYMSPEQVRGSGVDHRTDIFALGCVLYEMLTGRQTFQGETVTDIVASVLAREPNYKVLDSRVHPRVIEILRRCLEKDRKRRWQSIPDVRLELQQTLTNAGRLVSHPLDDASPRRPTLRQIVPWVAAALILGVLAGAIFKPKTASEPHPLVRYDYVVPEGQAFRAAGRSVIAFSPDGRHFVYNTNQGLYLRSMDSMAARLIPGTELGLTNPFFSPDGEWIGYFTGGEIRKIAITGGAPVTVCKGVTNPLGASWSPNGTILVGQPAGIMRVSDQGGEAKVVIKAENGEVLDGPQLLPDGDAVIFSVTRVQATTRWDQAQIVAQSLKSGERRILLQGGSDAHYAPSGHLVYATGDVLFAAPFDLKQLTVTGGAVPIIQGVQRALNPIQSTGTANYAFSNSGALVYVTGGLATAAPGGILGLVDTNGMVQRLNVSPAQYRTPRVSPDGRHLAVDIIPENGQTAIWIYDLDGKTAIRRLTEIGNNSTRPLWTPDSKRLAFASDREKAQGIYWQLADGSALPERLTTAPDGVVQFPESWSPDGRILSFASVKGGFQGTNWSLWTLSMAAKNQPQLFYDNPTSNEFGSTFSPDGRWIAYASSEGQDNSQNNPAGFGIYVQPFPPTGVKYLISQGGGAWPVWSPTGKELFYRMVTGNNAGQKFNAVKITTNPVPAFSSEASTQIRDFLSFTNERDYDILPNGRQFLMILPANQTIAQQTQRPRIQVVLNWFTELQQRVPVK
jgi:serine/threonine protein kinase/Tol biopolymer transport system component